jgi:hypothetical protein
MASPIGPQPLSPPESNAWWQRLVDIFKVKYTDTLLEVRGEGTGIDLDRNLTNGYRYADQRGSVTADKWVQGSRGHQSAIPTPQELIRQVTGVGDPTRGR